MRQEYSELRCLIPGQKGLIIGSRPMAAARQTIEFLARSSLSGVALEAGAGLDRHLLQRSRSDDDEDSLLCLRCRISHPIEARLRALQQQHGERHGLDLITMASVVLDDAGSAELLRGLPFRWSSLSQVSPPSLHPFSAEVLRSYRPDLCGLPHWARQKVQSHPELKTYLRQQGLLLISDWALLAHSSPSRVREALNRCGTLPLEDALALHRAYGAHYSEAKEQHRRHTGRRSDWRPDARFLAAIAPGEDPSHCLEQLLAIATAVRRYLSAPPVPLDAPAAGADQTRIQGFAAPGDPAATEDSGPSASELQQRVQRALARASAPVVRQALAADRPRWQKDDSRRLAWRLYGEGLAQRDIAERCAHQQGWVSKLLQERRLATTIATAAALELLRDPAFAALAQSATSRERLVEALRNHLLEPKPEADVAPLRAAVARALPTAASSPAP